MNETTRHIPELSDYIRDAIAIKTVFSFNLFGYTVHISDTILSSWIIIALICIGAIILSTRLKEKPRGIQLFFEGFIVQLDNFGEATMGKYAKYFMPYFGSILIYLIIANTISYITPLSFESLGLEVPFKLKPPTRDVNITSALAAISLVMILASGFIVRGPVGWVKRLFHPAPFMVIFNLLDYLIRPFALCLRLLGNIMAAFIIMQLIEFYVPIILPTVLGLYFDIFDGLIQAVVLPYLTMAFIAEAVETEEHHA